jgi:hypothetical protein
MEQKIIFGPCDTQTCINMGLLCAAHEACTYFNVRTGNFCDCPCHNAESSAKALEKLLGYAPKKREKARG